MEENNKFIRTEKGRRKEKTRRINPLKRRETEEKDRRGEEQGGENQRFRRIVMKETKR